MADRPKRLQSQTERDVEGYAARQKRDAVAAAATPEYVCDDPTGQYDAGLLTHEELKEQRRTKRTTDQSVEHLYDRMDAVRNAERAKTDALVAKLLERADSSVTFGRALAWKIIVAILGALAAYEAYLLKAHS